MDKKELKKYLEEIEEKRYYGPQSVAKICRMLIAEGKATKDDEILVYGLYYSIESDFRMGKSNAITVKRVAHVLQLAQNTKLFKIECRACNMLGICLKTQGDYVSALDYYQMGLDIATKHRDKWMIRLLLNNIGDLYLQVHEYNISISYLKKNYKLTMELFEKQQKEGTLHVFHVNISLLNLAEVYFQLGQYEKSISYLEQIYPEEGVERPFYSPSVNSLYAMNYLKSGEWDKAAAYMEEVVCAAEDGFEKIDSVKEYQRLCDELIAMERLDHAERLLKALYPIVKDLNYLNQWCDYYKANIEYAKKKNDSELLIEAYGHYYEWKKKQDAEAEQQQRLALSNRRELNKEIRKNNRMEVSNKRLKRMSEHDVLTGLYNRYVLNNECEQWCRESRESGRDIGIIIMDVDYFKQYNDTYGHLQGDECLKTVSSALTSAVNGEGIIARYGGDEFFVLLRDKSEEEVLACAKRISAQMLEKKLPHESSLVSDYVTLSQGLVNGTLEENQSVLDLIHLADNALYRAKEVKRSSIGVCSKDGYHVYQSEGIGK